LNSLPTAIMKLNRPIWDVTSRFATHTASVIISATYINHLYDVGEIMAPVYFSGSESDEKKWSARFGPDKHDASFEARFQYADSVCVVEGKGELQIDSSPSYSYVCRVGGYEKDRPVLKIPLSLLDPGQTKYRISFTVKYFRPVDEVRQIQRRLCPDSDGTFHDVVYLEDLLSSGKYADLSFVVGDEVIPAHKAIIAARVPYFDKMLSSGMEEAETGLVKLDEGTDVAAFKEVLKYIYGGQLPATLHEDAVQILQLADRYDLALLKDACFYHMQKGLTKDNVCETLILADLYRGSNLKKECLQQLHQWGSSLDSKVLEKLSEHPRLMIEVIQSE